MRIKKRIKLLYMKYRLNHEDRVRAEYYRSEEARQCSSLMCRWLNSPAIDSEYKISREFGKWYRLQIKVKKEKPEEWLQYFNKQDMNYCLCRQI